MNATCFENTACTEDSLSVRDYRFLWMLVEDLFERFNEHLGPSKIQNNRKGDLIRLRLRREPKLHFQAGSWTARDIQMTNSVPATRENMHDDPRYREIATCRCPRHICGGGTEDSKDLIMALAITETLVIDKDTLPHAKLTRDDINRIDEERKKMKNRIYIANKGEGEHARRSQAIRVQGTGQAALGGRDDE
ncbi:hypothetical protein FANTH_13926 [Fusarium anthophilum]|uniref:Uncharacterized protein n=1 Tax=Fusarium anthophilum TaxID=48485 RepID=A0A8H4YLP3_9HYPO|nr:hypothetical protein FANTH_13926 [Fusarium anthophilum]